MVCDGLFYIFIYLFVYFNILYVRVIKISVVQWDQTFILFFNIVFNLEVPEMPIEKRCEKEKSFMLDELLGCIEWKAVTEIVLHYNSGVNAVLLTPFLWVL